MDESNTEESRWQASQKAAQNTDRELWREREGDYYADSIHVTKDGGIGINSGGTVYVKSLRNWHELASAAHRRLNKTQPQRLLEEIIPNPASGEWTVESASEIVGNVWNRNGIIEQLADAHNAEQEKYARSQERVRMYFDLLAAAQELLAEVRQWHSDKESPDYNECDTAPCQWCESSLKLGTDCMDAHVRQKTWELEKQLAAAVAALKKVNALARGNKTGCGTCNCVIDATITALKE